MGVSRKRCNCCALETMLFITDKIALDENEIRLDFIRASGPGGQNVNKVASAVQLRFDAAGSPSLPEDVRRRLIRLAGNRITVSGELIIEARRFRTQEANRRDALDRLKQLIRKASQKPRRRKKTRAPAAVRRRRLENKRRRSRIKQLRGPVSGSE